MQYFCLHLGSQILDICLQSINKEWWGMYASSWTYCHSQHIWVLLVREEGENGCWGWVGSCQSLLKTSWGVQACLEAAPNLKHLTYKTAYIYKRPALLLEKTSWNLMLWRNLWSATRKKARKCVMALPQWRPLRDSASGHLPPSGTFWK